MLSLPGLSRKSMQSLNERCHQNCWLRLHRESRCGDLQECKPRSPTSLRFTMDCRDKPGNDKCKRMRRTIAANRWCSICCS